MTRNDQNQWRATHRVQVTYTGSKEDTLEVRLDGDGYARDASGERVFRVTDGEWSYVGRRRIERFSPRAVPGRKPRAGTAAEIKRSPRLSRDEFEQLELASKASGKPVDTLLREGGLALAAKILARS